MSRVYFTDRDLGKQFPALLAAAGLRVERHADLFPANGSDEQWLEYCGSHGRVALTHNSRIRYVPNERAAVRRFEVSLVVVVGKAPLPDLARSVVHSLPKIEAALAAHPPPRIFKIYRPTPAELGRNVAAPGRVEVWWP